MYKTILLRRTGDVLFEEVTSLVDFGLVNAAKRSKNWMNVD